MIFSEWSNVKINYDSNVLSYIDKYLSHVSITNIDLECFSELLFHSLLFLLIEIVVYFKILFNKLILYLLWKRDDHLIKLEFYFYKNKSEFYYFE